MQRWNCLVVALVFLSVVVGGQQVVPVFASPSGTPANAGSLASPFDLVTAFNSSQGHLSQNSSVSLFIASGVYSVNQSLQMRFASNAVKGDVVFSMIGINPDDPPTLNIPWGIGMYPTQSTFTFRLQNLNLPGCGQLEVVDNYGCIAVNGANFTIEMNNVNIIHASHALAPSGGAATVTASGTLSFIATNCLFGYNVAHMGAAIYLSSTNALVDAVFKNTQFIGNAVTTSSGAGGALYLSNTNTLALDHCLFDRNIGQEVIYLNQPAQSQPIDILIRNTQIVYNRGAVFGYPPASVIQYNLQIANQSALAFNTIGLSVPSGCNASISSESILWGNQEADLICSGTGVAVLNKSGVDLCAVQGTCSKTGSRWDRCYVCNGTDACLICSPGNGCTGFVFIPENQNNSLTSITYGGGGNPDPTLYPLEDGQADANRFLQIEFVEVNETRPDGSEVVTVPLDSQAFLITNSVNTNNDTSASNTTIQFGYYTAIFKTAITIIQTYFLNSTSLSQNNLTFSVNPQTLKVSISISNWPFEGGINSTNTLSLTIRVNTGEQITSLQTTTTTIGRGFKRTETNFSTSNTFGLISFLEVALFNRNGSFSELGAINVLQLANESNSTSTAFIMQFQGYFDQVLYDPDFGVLVAPQGTSSSGDGGSNLGLIIGLSVGIPVAFLIVLLVIILGMVVAVLARNRKRAKLNGNLAQVSRETSGIIS